MEYVTRSHKMGLKSLGLIQATGKQVSFIFVFLVCSSGDARLPCSNEDTRLPRKCYHALKIPQVTEEFPLHRDLLRPVLVSEGRVGIG